MLCQVVFFRNLGGFFVRDVRAKKFAVSERGKDALDGEDLFFFCHFFCFNFHTSSIAAKREERKGIRKVFSERFLRKMLTKRARRGIAAVVVSR